MISRAVLCPHPPLLLRELGGAADPVEELRAAAVDAVRAATSGAARVVVVGGHEDEGRWDPDLPVDVRRFGTTGRPPPRPALPLSLGVATRLLGDAGWTGPVELLTLPWHAGTATVDALADDLAGRPDGTVLLLLGDGSTRRGDTAPGYLDDRAFGFDDTVAKALADGDAHALRDLEVGLAEELMVLGSAAFRVLGSVAVRQGGPSLAALDHREDPFGVSYFVATWMFRAGTSAARDEQRLRGPRDEAVPVVHPGGGDPDAARPEGGLRVQAHPVAHRRPQHVHGQLGVQEAPDVRVQGRGHPGRRVDARHQPLDGAHRLAPDELAPSAASTPARGRARSPRR